MSIPPANRMQADRVSSDHVMLYEAPGARLADTAAAAADPTPIEAALRRKWSILAFAVGGALAMLGVLSLVTPRFVATAQVRIDIPQPRIVDENAAVLPSERPTLEAVNTEMVALDSPALAKTAAVSLGLQHLRAFQLCPAVPLVQRIATLLRAARGAAAMPPPACVEDADYAGKILLGRMSFSADRGSYVIDVSATAADPVLAAKIANGYAGTYIAWQRDMKAKLAQDADIYLSNQLRTLHDQMVAADAAVESYRQSHNLIGLHAGPDGQSAGTVRSGRLAQASQALGDAEAQLADKRSIVAQVRAALRRGDYDQVAPALQSPVVQSLLERHADLSGKLAQLRAQYGTSYPLTIATAAELARNDSQINIEVGRVGAALDAELAALSRRSGTIAAQVKSLEGDVAGESEADVGLQELQREATSDRSVYETSFVRLKQLDAERFLERANADIVVEAMPPDVPEFPHKHMMAAGAFLACLGIGTGGAFLREMLSRRFRDAAQIEEQIGVPVTGIFAKRRNSPQSLTIDMPRSIETETIHATLTQLLGARGGSSRKRGLITLLTSSLPGEGKSCFTVALGRAAASIGLSVIVLDCDLRRPAVRALITGRATRDVTPDNDDTVAAASANEPETTNDGDAPVGDKALVETKALVEPAALTDDDALLDDNALIDSIMRQCGTDPLSGLRYLALADHVDNPRGLLTWVGLPALLAHLRPRFDLILLDAPPVLAVSDPLHLGSLADRVLLLIDWQATPRDAVAASVRALARAGVAITGAVMTKVDIRRYARAGAGRSLYVGQVAAYHDKAA